MFELVDNYSQNAVIKVIGVGGGGGNAVEQMIESKIHGAEFLLANTDAQALNIKGARTVQIGDNITKGLGAGADPEIGRQAAEDDKEKLTNAISGADMLFITAGMGGGTGSGAAPVIAQLARDMGILTVAVVTKPYEFEGSQRMKHAQEGIDNLEGWVDSLIVIPNDRLKEVYGGTNSIFQVWENANDVLRNAVKGIAEIITIRGLINVDFADVKTVMSGKGKAMMGSGVARGDNRAVEAVQSALSSPLLENLDLHDASGVLVNVTAGSDLSPEEYETIGNAIKDISREDATIIAGCIKEEENVGELRVTVIATGFEEKETSHETSSVEVAKSAPAFPIGGGMESMTLRKPAEITADAAFVNTAPEIGEGSVPAQQQENIDIPAFLRQQAD